MQTKNIFHHMDIHEVDIGKSVLVPGREDIILAYINQEYLIVDSANSALAMEFYQNYMLDNSIVTVPIAGIGMLGSIDFYKIKTAIEQVDRDAVIDTHALSRAEKELDAIFEKAVLVKASDIHIRRDDTVATLSFRVNGMLRDISAMSVKACDELLFVLYNILASTKESSWNVAQPQDANIIRYLKVGTYRFRYAHMPIFGVASGCYHAVMRIIKVETEVTFSQIETQADPMDKLGFAINEKNALIKIMQQPYGLFVVCGVTGSGKSTSIKSVMEWMYYKKYAGSGVFLTVEDPVEYKINGAIQSSVVRRGDDIDPFLPAIKSAMRRDPDVLMVGETRDGHTAKAIVGAVESGHYCVTTVHAGSVIAALQRMESLGISKSRLAVPGFMAGIMAQALVARLCGYCKVALPDRVNGRQLYHSSPIGCERCNQTGIAGRLLVVELFLPTPKELILLAADDINAIYHEWRKKRNDTLSIGFEIKEKIYMNMMLGEVDACWFRDFYGDIDDDSKEIILNAI